MKPRHRRNRHGVWVDAGWDCFEKYQNRCKRRWSIEQIRGFAREKQSIDTQAEKFVKAYVRRQRRAARLAGQIPVVEER